MTQLSKVTKMAPDKHEDIRYYVYWVKENTPYCGSWRDEEWTCLRNVVQGASVHSNSDLVAEYYRFRTRPRAARRFRRSIRNVASKSVSRSVAGYDAILSGFYTDPSPGTSDITAMSVEENVVFECKDYVPSFVLDISDDALLSLPPLPVRLLLSNLLAKDPTQRAKARNALLSFPDPSSVAEAVLMEFDRTGQSELLLHLKALLEDVGPRAWDALKTLADSGRDECALFVGPIASCPGVQEAQRVEALRAIASNPSHVVRSRIYEYLGELTRGEVKAVLDVLAKDPDAEIRKEARLRLSSLDDDL
jgi:hypothetical protein